ncbi:MAG: formate/nitrite transporter family protein [Angelakisella sp.]
MKWMKVILSGVAAGVMIGVGGTVYLSAPDKTVGAVLFAIGLLTICLYSLRLYTGAIGYLLTGRESSWANRLLTAGAIWLGNYIGTTGYGVLLHMAKPELAAKAAALCDAKLTQSVPYNLFMAVLCGLLMYLAVDIYKKQTDFGRFLGIFFAVPVFILSGFEHSIANMFYFAIGYGQLLPSAQVLFFLLVVTVGNSLGSVLLPTAAKAAA